MAARTVFSVRGQFRGRAIARQDMAGHRVVGHEMGLVGECLKCRQAPAAGDDLVADIAVGVGLDGPHEQVLQNAVGGDRSLQFVEGGTFGGRLPDVLRRRNQPVQGKALEGAFGTVMGKYS